MANTALVLNLRMCSFVVYSMDVLNCCFAEVAVDLCPCDNIIPYETVACKGEGGSLTGPHAHFF